jgi:hypothetical protein
MTDFNAKLILDFLDYLERIDKTPCAAAMPG